MGKIKLSSSFWNDRYKTKQTGWDIGKVSTPLKGYFDQLENDNQKIIIAGGGNGYEAEYLFNKGFQQVCLLDWAVESLTQFKSRVENFPKSNLINENFFDHHEKYDLVVEQTFFCAIEPHLRSLYAKHVYSLLNVGGKLVGLLFDDPLNADHPPYGGNKEEYLRYFKPYFEIKYFDDCYNSVPARQGRELFILLVKKELNR